MFNYMACSQDMVEQGVKKFGPAPGAKKILDQEYQHAKQALETGIYMTYSNINKNSECSRLGSLSACFCGHTFSKHNHQIGKKFDTKCNEKCECKIFKFVPTRPEECGMYWLPRRKDFNVNTWKPPCKCKHTTAQHTPNYPLRCKSCKTCMGFNSNFACISCDDLWENHQVLYQNEQERKMQKKPIGQAYLPLSTHKNIQQVVFKDPKYKLIQGPKQTPQEKKQSQIRTQSLNPKQPSKLQQGKLKSPFGFVFKPKYPDFLKK